MKRKSRSPDSEAERPKAPAPQRPGAGPPQAEGRTGRTGAAVTTGECVRDREEASVAGPGGTQGLWAQMRLERGRGRGMQDRAYQYFQGDGKRCRAVSGECNNPIYVSQSFPGCCVDNGLGKVSGEAGRPLQLSQQEMELRRGEWQ